MKLSSLEELRAEQEKGLKEISRHENRQKSGGSDRINDQRLVNDHEPLSFYFVFRSARSSCFCHVLTVCSRRKARIGSRSCFISHASRAS